MTIRTIQTNVHPLHRRERAAENLDIGSESFAAVLTMSSIGLTLSFLIIFLVAS